MPAAPLAEVTRFLDAYLGVGRVPDYPYALNGLQVQGSGRVERFAVAVDASEAVIEAVKAWADLLIVHHGLFWGGLQPLTGPHFRRVKALVESGTALYSAHLPLDAHAEVGNAAVLARELGVESLEPFGDYNGTPVGWRGTVRGSVAGAGHDGTTGHGGAGGGAPVTEVAERLAAATGSEVRILPGGPEMIATAGVVTGAGASALREAAAAGVDLLVTGEAQHHHAIEAAELGVTVLLGGHYATETWGVKAVARVIEDHFGIVGRFVDSPTGL